MLILRISGDTHRISRLAEIYCIGCELRKHQALRILSSARLAVSSDLVLVRYDSQTIHVHELNEEIDNVIDFDRSAKVASCGWWIVGRNHSNGRNESFVPNDMEEVSVKVATAQL